jgi:hypothetical protein
MHKVAKKTAVYDVPPEQATFLPITRTPRCVALLSHIP